MPRQKPKFTQKLMKERIFNDSKQMTYKIMPSKGNFEIDEIENILNSVNNSAISAGHNIQTMVRIPTLLGPRTVKMFSGELNLQQYEDYFEGKVAETGKFEKIAYIEFTILKQN
jgi:hypothetical protein